MFNYNDGAPIAEDSDFCPEDIAARKTVFSKAPSENEETPFFKEFLVWIIAGVSLAIAIVAFIKRMKS